MKRIIVIFAAMVFAAIQMNAQVSIEAGYLNTMYSSKAFDSNEKENMKPFDGFTVGVNDDIRLVAGLSIQPGLYYSYGTIRENKEVLGLNPKFVTTEHNLSIPVNIKYSFKVLPILNIYVYAGPTFFLGVASENAVNISGKIAGMDVSGEFRYNNYSGKIHSDNLSDELQEKINGYMPESNLSRFDVLVGGGIGVDLFKFLTVKGGYDYGLVNRYKGDAAKNAFLNRSQFYISIGFKFGK